MMRISNMYLIDKKMPKWTAANPNFEKLIYFQNIDLTFYYLKSRSKDKGNCSRKNKDLNREDALSCGGQCPISNLQRHAGQTA